MDVTPYTAASPTLSAPLALLAAVLLGGWSLQPVGPSCLTARGGQLYVQPGCLTTSREKLTRDEESPRSSAKPGKRPNWSTTPVAEAEEGGKRSNKNNRESHISLGRRVPRGHPGISPKVFVNMHKKKI